MKEFLNDGGVWFKLLLEADIIFLLIAPLYTLLVTMLLFQRYLEDAFSFVHLQELESD